MDARGGQHSRLGDGATVYGAGVSLLRARRCGAFLLGGRIQRLPQTARAGRVFRRETAFHVIPSYREPDLSDFGAPPGKLLNICPTGTDPVYRMFDDKPGHPALPTPPVPTWWMVLCPPTCRAIKVRIDWKVWPFARHASNRDLCGTTDRAVASCQRHLFVQVAS